MKVNIEECTLKIMNEIKDYEIKNDVNTQNFV